MLKLAGDGLTHELNITFRLLFLEREYFRKISAEVFLSYKAFQAKLFLELGSAVEIVSSQVLDIVFKSLS